MTDQTRTDMDALTKKVLKEMKLLEPMDERNLSSRWLKLEEYGGSKFLEYGRSLGRYLLDNANYVQDKGEAFNKWIEYLWRYHNGNCGGETWHENAHNTVSLFMHYIYPVMKEMEISMSKLFIYAEIQMVIDPAYKELQCHNTANGETNLSHDFMWIEDGESDYVDGNGDWWIAPHLAGDLRWSGGYGKFVPFQFEDDYPDFSYFQVDAKDGTGWDTGYDGYNLTDEEGNELVAEDCENREDGIYHKEHGKLSW